MSVLSFRRVTAQLHARRRLAAIVLFVCLAAHTFTPLHAEPTRRSLAELGKAFLQPNAADAAKPRDPVVEATEALTPTGQRHAIERDRLLREQLRNLDWITLTADEKVDAILLTNAIAYQIWEITTERPWQRDVVGLTEQAAGFLADLAQDDQRSWMERMRVATDRMERLPALFDQIRHAIVPALVTAERAQLALKQSEHLFDELVAPFDAHVSDLPDDERQRYAHARLALKDAIARHRQWLEAVVAPGAKGSAALGPALYDQKVEFELGAGMGPAEIERRARAEDKSIRQRMYSIAVKVLESRRHRSPLPESPSRAEQQAAIEEALELTYQQRLPPNGLLSAAREAVDSAQQFVVAHHLVSVPKEKVRLAPMPAYLAGVVPAFCGQVDGIPQVDIATIPTDWDAKRTARYLAEYNRYAMADLLIHEAMPGHYVQFSHALSGVSDIRASLPSGSFAEGWATYAEGMMLDAGYYDRDPLFALTVLKVRLRAVASALLDIGVHTRGMTEAEGVALMTQEAFLSPDEALSRYRRSTLQPTQLLRYFVGYTAIMALQDEAKTRQGKAFDLFAFNNEVLAHGAPPVPLLRMLMFDLQPPRPD